MSAGRGCRRSLRARLAVTLVLAVSAVACSSEPVRDVAVVPAADGTSPRDPRFEYQPDVVFVHGGEQAVLGASSDGLTWTLDGAAKGVGELRPGVVLYATATTVGRVTEVTRSGDDVVVRLAPVALTEVFREADFEIDQRIDTDELDFQTVPDLPGALDEDDGPSSSVEVRPGDEGTGGDTTSPTVTIAFPTGGADAAGDAEPETFETETFETEPVRLIARRQDTGKRLPPRSKAKTKVGLGEWEVEPTGGPGALGLKVTRKAGDSLKVSLDVSIKTKDLRIRSSTRIRGGQYVGGGAFVIEGLESIGIAIAAGSEIGAAANRKVRIDVPVDITWPIPGEPLVYSNKWKFSIETAIAGNNSTITGAGLWRLAGSLGFVDGKPTTPTMTTEKSILDSLAGIALAPSGVVLAVETKMQFGIGLPAAFTGPYAKMVVSLGLVNGSAFGAPLVRCVGGTLDAWLGGGFGFSVSSKVFGELKELFLKEMKMELEIETLYNFKHVTDTIPPVGSCIS